MSHIRESKICITQRRTQNEKRNYQKEHDCRGIKRKTGQNESSLCLYSRYRDKEERHYKIPVFLQT